MIYIKSRLYLKLLANQKVKKVHSADCVNYSRNTGNKIKSIQKFLVQKTKKEDLFKNLSKNLNKRY